MPSQRPYTSSAYAYLSKPAIDADNTAHGGLGKLRTYYTYLCSGSCTPIEGTISAKKRTIEITVLTAIVAFFAIIGGEYINTKVF